MTASPSADNIEVIDESEVQSPPITALEPKLRSTSYHLIRALRDISKLFIWLSFILVGIVAVIGIFRPEFSKSILSLVWDKLGAVYLVIFGNMLGKNNRK